VVDIIGYIAGILVMISFLPQLIKTIRTKSAKDISMGMLWICLCSNTLYITYGLMLSLWPIVITLAIANLIVVSQIFYTIKYRKAAIN